MSSDADIPNVYIEHGSHSIDCEPVELKVTYPSPSFLVKNDGSLLNFEQINEIFYHENDRRLIKAICRIQETEGMFENRQCYIAIADEDDYGMTLFVSGRENANMVADRIRNVRVALNNDKRMNVKIV
jgi:hypothetical protein